MVCSVSSCENPTIAKGLCSKHYQKWKKYGNPLAGYEEQSPKGLGSKKNGRYHRMHVKGKEVLKHRIIAEEIYGKPLPKGYQIHHKDENLHNNNINNLVICMSAKEHKQIHVEKKALEVCGNANWRKCNICQIYDDPKNMYVNKRFPHVRYHRECRKKQRRRKWKTKQ